METLQDTELRKEKNGLRKSWGSHFLNELDIIIEKCFLRPKEKKEHFITPDKISIELLKLLQSQKKFQPPTCSKINLKLLAIFSNEDNIIGKIKSIYFDIQEVEYFDMFCNIKKKSLSEVIIFDVYSPELQIYFEKQKRFYDSFSYKQVFGFLTEQTNKEEKNSPPIRMTTVSGVQQIKLGIHIDY